MLSETLVTMDMVWKTVRNIAIDQYGMSKLEADIYAWCCCARASWKDWEKLEH